MSPLNLEASARSSIFMRIRNHEPWIVEGIVLLHLTDAEGLVTKKCIKPASASH